MRCVLNGGVGAATGVDQEPVGATAPEAGLLIVTVPLRDGKGAVCLGTGAGSS